MDFELVQMFCPSCGHKITGYEETLADLETLSYVENTCDTDKFTLTKEICDRFI